MLNVDLKPYLSAVDKYTELRLQENVVNRMFMTQGNLVANNKSVTNGLSARTFHSGAWGFGSYPGFDESIVKKTLELSSENALFLGKRKNKPVQLETFSHEVVKDFHSKKERLSQKDKVDFLKSADHYITSKYNDLTTRTVGFIAHHFEKNFINSDGAIGKTFYPRTLFVCNLGVEKNGAPITYREIVGGMGEFQDQFSKPEDLYKTIDKAYSKLMEKKHGVLPTPGVHDVIIGAEVTGILAHEAVGHTTEADLVLGGSVAGDYLGEKVASDKVTLVDFAYEVLGKPCPVPVHIDDEGTPAEDAVIIDKGTLKSFMHNKETAAHFEVKPQGNARAFSFDDEPLIRMRNTAVMPGNETLEDLIGGIDKGYYFIQPSNGQADTTGEFMFGVTFGYEIDKGKLSRPLLDSTISGVAFDVLKTVDGVSNAMAWETAGFCGKKQPMVVGFGGPDLKCRVSVGG